MVDGSRADAEEGLEEDDAGEEVLVADADDDDEDRPSPRRGRTIMMMQ
jgi:hypothetical protein